jgi:ubiquinone/menaquinone biosynthesis C-methylase UbiE
VNSDIDEKLWDERYRSAPLIWSGEPNEQLVAEVSPLTPGTALDVGCGEGADAIWLAERGWRVTAVDISSVALERAKTAAAARDVTQRIAWLHADLIAPSWPLADASYDLVSAFFVQQTKERREKLFRVMASAVKPGGTLLVVGHHPDDLKTGVRRPPAEMLYTSDEVAAVLDSQDWEIEINTVRERTVEKDGATVTVYDAVLRARRLR